jgi:hypothetical protein
MPHDRITHGMPWRQGGGTGHGIGRGGASMICELAVEAAAVKAMASVEMNERMTHR